ncbi:MAG TPA: hypothetical protein VN684_12320 [Terriglobales bacterium]|nr:hypothetical protein [Terriglobales bacterium]
MSLCLLAGASIGGAATVTVGPSGAYATPCAAFSHLSDGDTVQVDANSGTPYNEGNCFITNNNITISGVNGRPILDATGVAIDKAIWVVDGHDVVIDNFEFRNASVNGDSGSSSNAEGIRAEEAVGGSGGGNMTVQHCYIHDNGTGILTGSADGSNKWYSSSNFFTFQYDEFAFNGAGDSQTHNIYMGDDTNDNTTFTMQYSWTHDSNAGQLLKDREPNSNIYYNWITDTAGQANYLIDIPQAGTTYLVGNVVYRTTTPNNQVVMIYGNNGDAPNGFYSSKEDLHVINNTLLDNPSNTFPGDFVSIGCFSGATSSCSAPPVGSGITTNAVIENNIFLGGASGSPYAATNQSTAYLAGNVVEANTSSNVSAMGFNNAAELDFRLVSNSSPAYLVGIYPPTNNAGTSDSAALATEEYSPTLSGVSRPTPSGSTMDAGAYHYQTVTSPSLTVTATTPITSPNTGTITVSGLPTPPSGQFNYASFISTNLSAIGAIHSAASSTTSITTTFQAESVASSTVVPVYIYVDGTVIEKDITVNPGPPGLQSLTLDDTYYPDITLHLSGPGTSPLIVNLSSSDSSILWAPSSITVPASTLTMETGTLNGTLWTPAISSKGPVTLTATYGTQSVNLTTNIYSPGTHDFECVSPCTATGGSTFDVGYVLAGVSPVGGSTIYITSSNTAVIPNQSYFMAAGVRGPTGADGFGYIDLTSNSVSTPTNVVLTATYNGSAFYVTPTITVNPSSGPTVSSVTLDNTYGATTTVHLSSAAPSGGSTVSLSSSNSTILYAPSTVTVPSGSTSAETGTMQGSLWSPQLSAQGPVTLTATLGSSSAHLTTNIYSPEVYAFSCSSCSVVGGNSYNYVGFQLSGGSPYGGSTVYITSSNPSVIPNQSTVIPAGMNSTSSGYLSVSTNAVSTSTNVQITATYDGSAYSTTPTITVTP